jgi:alpha-tubulin suppressor-like RCC1 family protein
MKNTGMVLRILFSLSLVLCSIGAASVVGASGTGPLPDDRSVGYSVLDSYSAVVAAVLDVAQGNVMPMVTAGAGHTVGLKSNGTVIAVGDNDDGQCSVGDWIGIVQVAAGDYHTVALKSDGTVVAVGYDDDDRCNVGGWTDIVQVAAGHQHTVGVESDGAVVAVGYDVGQCDVGEWTDIIQVAAGDLHTVGLRSDGTVVAVGTNSNGQCEVGDWTDIIQIAAGSYHTVGLDSDGTVVATGDAAFSRSNVSGWTDIIQLAAGNDHTVGLKSDGTVVDTWHDVSSWGEIIQIAAGAYHTVGLKEDGTVVAVGDSSDGQCNVDSWNLVLAVPASQCTLAISGGYGGWVGSPGEGGFICDEGTIVDLAAKHYEGYRFAEWTGEVAAIADVHAATTTITMNSDYAIEANFELEEGLCSLAINSTEGGSVTTPGEGIFVYDRGTTVVLAAEAEAGYRLDHWDIRVDGQEIRSDSANTGVTSITLVSNSSVLANFVVVEAGNVGVRAGDWIKVDYEITGWPAEQPRPEWLKLEFLNLEGTTASMRVTMGMSDGTEQSDTAPALIGEGGGEALGLAGFVIPPNLTTGDSIYITGHGDVTIDGETTGTYAGASRTAIHASFSESGVQLTYYWDKETGVMLEASSTFGDVTATGRVTETNMWEPRTEGMPWWPWIVVGLAVVGLVIFFMRRRARGSATT